MFEHSVKVPRHYKVAANILKKVSTEGGSVKTLLYDDKLRHFKTNVLFALITETIKHAADIDKLFKHCNILNTETRLDPWLAKVLTTELLFGKKALPGNSKPEQTILSYKESFDKYISEHQDDLKNEAKPRPRYVRVNTNLYTTSDAIRTFQDEGFRFIRCTSGSYDDYLQQIQNLTEFDFTQDYHVKTVFVFCPGTKWHDHELYLENKIILQDKATTMAVHLLAPPPGSVVVDMCAAPGMKTTQLAAFMRNEGKIYAVERNEDRYNTLKEFVERTGCKCVETFHKDSFEMKRGEYDDVEYVILDPSCSGSGMDFSVHNYIEDTRLAKLTSLQEKFLKHAMNAFPKAKRIVYSTCSLFPEENERVITNVVKTSRAKWRVQDVKELLKGQWNNFGSAMYGSMGTRCMYAKPASDFTTGFFLAVLDRDEKDLAKANKVREKGDDNIEAIDKDPSNKIDVEGDCADGVNDSVTEGVKKNKKDRNDAESDVINEKVIKHVTEDAEVAKEIINGNTIESIKKKKKKRDRNDAESDVINEKIIKHVTEDAKVAIEIINGNTIESIKKKKKKRDRNDTQSEEIVNEEVIESINQDVEAVARKKKKKKGSKTENVDVVESDSENVGVTATTKNKLKQDNVDVINDTVSVSVKKKKKHFHEENIENNTIKSSETDLPEKKAKKKKKRKHNDIEDIQENIDVSADLDQDNKKAAKKKKKISNINQV